MKEWMDTRYQQENVLEVSDWVLLTACKKGILARCSDASS